MVPFVRRIEVRGRSGRNRGRVALRCIQRTQHIIATPRAIAFPAPAIHVDCQPTRTVPLQTATKTLENIFSETKVTLNTILCGNYIKSSGLCSIILSPPTNMESKQMVVQRPK
ncbi:hypothetical protein JYU34_008788 [Plutella xylostella]|uniref:Uncharacterized protein n=1 Tax=Plutella xylostella TaxID=51655 RepID=A0ABQ7QLT1_PLUXY|nr:hypothetical protein JYU34_008788 [Plutella xylostella]